MEEMLEKSLTQTRRHGRVVTRREGTEEEEEEGKGGQIYGDRGRLDFGW